MGIIVRNMNMNNFSHVGFTYKRDNVRYWSGNRLFNSKYEVVHEFPTSYVVFSRHDQFMYMFDNSTGWYIKYNLFTKESENIWQTGERISTVQTVNSGIYIASFWYDPKNDFICYGRNDRWVVVISVKEKTRLYATYNFNTSTATYRRVMNIRVIDDIIYCQGDRSMTAANIHTQQVLWRRYNGNVFVCNINPNNSDEIVVNYGWNINYGPIGVSCFNRFDGSVIWTNNASFNQISDRAVGIIGIDNEYLYTHQRVSNVVRVLDINTGAFVRSSSISLGDSYGSFPRYVDKGNILTSNGVVVAKDSLTVDYIIPSFSGISVYDDRVINSGYSN